MTRKAKFIPALKFNKLTRFFDPLMSLTGMDKKTSQALLSQAQIRDKDNVLDFGCGSGNLAIIAKKQTPKANIHGLDIDPKILKIARDKAGYSGYTIFLQDYDGKKFPYKNESFNKVLSSLVFHHLSREEKIIVLGEIYRVLKEAGELHILDFGKASNILMRGIFLPIRIFDGFANTYDNINGSLPKIIEQAGFQEVTEDRSMMTPFGAISLYKAVKST